MPRDELTAVKHFIGCVASVKRTNTDEWMEFICDELNNVFAAIGDKKHVVKQTIDGEELRLVRKDGAK